MIPIAKPYIGPEEHAAIAEVLESGMLANGPQVRLFERAFADYINVPAAVACSSGTAGLVTAVAALDLPHGSKILTTPFSFIATANCILAAGCQPLFVDVDADTFNMTAVSVKAAFERDPDIRAVLPVHLYGQACEIHEIVEIAHAFGALVIEDCAQAHGATEGGVPVGAIADLGVFSFYPTKNMMTGGEGGMITGRHTGLLETCALLINHGSPVRYLHQRLGFNYRMTSIAGAIGLCQLQRLPAWNDARRQHARTLTAALAGQTWLTTPMERPECRHVYHQYVLTVRDRQTLQHHLAEAGVSTDVHYPRIIPDQPLFHGLGYSGETCPVARELAESVLSLPVHPGLSSGDLQKIITAIRAFEPAVASVG